MEVVEDTPERYTVRWGPPRLNLGLAALMGTVGLGLASTGDGALLGLPAMLAGVALVPFALGRYTLTADVAAGVLTLERRGLWSSTATVPLAEVLGIRGEVVVGQGGLFQAAELTVHTRRGPFDVPLGPVKHGPEGPIVVDVGRGLERRRRRAAGEAQA